VSFFGGGTDYAPWIRKHGGAVLSAAVDKYCYISCRRLPPFFEHTFRVVYSKIEDVKHIEEIQHPAVRAVLSELAVTEGLEIHHDGDLPARSGIGSSSSFTVGLLNAVYGLRGQRVSSRQLAESAIRIEQEVIGETVGSQDQIAAAYGGLNMIRFHPGGGFDVEPVLMLPERYAALQAHLLIFFTGISRIASEAARVTVASMAAREAELLEIRRLVDEGLEILTDQRRSLEEFGRLLHESWMLKRSLEKRVSNGTIDKLYEKACLAGALGGKLLGAGGGGFLLAFVPPERQQDVARALSPAICIPIKFDRAGSRVIVFEPE
jgi:D-glycero-alpha-D-manno-heptose-7-phosphate kinase